LGYICDWQNDRHSDISMFAMLYEYKFFIVEIIHKKKPIKGDKVMFYFIYNNLTRISSYFIFIITINTVYIIFQRFFNSKVSETNSKLFTYK